MLVLVAAVPAAKARENLDTERALADVMIAPRNARSLAERETEGVLAEIIGSWPEPSAPGAAGEEEEERSWAVLPQVGYSPDQGVNAGVKYVDRSIGSRQLTLDFGGVLAIEGQRRGKLTLVVPEVWTRRLVGVVEAEYYWDPTHEFFGLGNNEIGPDALSTHEQEFLTGLFTLGFRPFPRLTLAFSVGFSDVDIDRGELEGDTPSTVEAFPDLTGIRGGRVNPVAASIVYNNRKDLTRPTRGWSFVAKVQHVDHRLENDFEYTRYILDASYLLPLPTQEQVLGVRLAGEFIDAEIRDIPFFEMASLGGDRNLRGFFQDRFLGRSRVMVNAEYRLQVADFRFFDWWNVRIDGVVFGDLGRVFLEDDELEREFRVDEELLPRLFEDFRYSYGGGTRIALGSAILARIDVGFSEEETALVYLTFGHTF